MQRPTLAKRGWLLLFMATAISYGYGLGRAPFMGADEPRYAEVASDLLTRIARGEYPVGSLLPKEVELSRSYGISRHTMREALRRLSDAGVVSRRRRAGTEVIAAQPSTSYRQPTGWFSRHG